MPEWPERGLPGEAVQSRKCGITAGAASPINEPADNKHTMKKALLSVGLDVHAQSITVALAPGDGTEARLYGTIPHDLHALEKVFAKLRKAHPGAEPRVCYEAGPTGKPSNNPPRPSPAASNTSTSAPPNSAFH